MLSVAGGEIGAISVLAGAGLLRAVILGKCAYLDRSAARAHVVEELDIGLVLVRPLFRHVIFVVDRIDRAHRFAGTAVDAFVGVDVEHPVTLVNAVDRAFINT